SGNQSSIIIVTSQGDEKIAVEAMKTGANDYIPKDLLTGEGIAQSVRYMVNLKEQATRQRELELQLSTTQNQLKAVVANSPIILFALNKNSEFTLFEGKGLEELKIDKEKFINQPLANFSKEIPIQQEYFHQALEGKEVKIVAEWGKKYFEIFYTSIRDNDNAIIGVIGIAADVTAHKRIQEQLENARQLAEETAKIKENFLANMSHEIRTPMNGIIGLTRILLNTNLNEEQSGYLNSIKMCSDNLMVIIDDILDFSKIEAGKMTFENVPFNLNQSVRHAIELFQAKADEKGIQLVSEVDPKLPAAISGDPTRLSQIINNLISNAIKFTEKGEVRIIARAGQKINDKVTVQFEVRDSGIGIPEKSISTIFDSFTQASSETTRKFGGTGLGLTIVKKLIELQNGEIQVKSKPGTGTTFSFHIDYPILESVRKVEVQKESDASISHLRILIAEDNKINQLVVRKIFSDWQATIDFADNGEEAVKLAKNGHYDLILMDIQMPVMEGLTASKTIRTTLPEPFCSVPIMAMTAHATASEKQKCKDHGMNDHINKPFDPLDLKKKIIALTQSENSSLKQVQNTHFEPKTAGVKLSTQSNKNSDTGASIGNSSPVTPSKESINHFLNAPKINLSYLKQIAEGNESFVIEMIEMFLNKTPEAITEMYGHFKNKNWDEFRKVAHRIKPSFGYMGMSEIQNALTKVEMMNEKELREPAVDELLIEIESRTSQAYAQLRTELTTLK
ncbi:MAG: response regulator, partial [Bacteroidota bacterium]